MNELQREIRRLSGLKQNKKQSEYFIQKEAQKNIALRELVKSGNFNDPSEEQKAKQIFDKYLEKIDFDDFSELSTLSMLVYNEILVGRIQQQINKISTGDKSYINDKLVKALHDAEDQVFDLKIKLRIDRKEEQSELNAFQESKKRFLEWHKENQNEFQCICAKCGTLLNLRRRCKDFDVMEHPSFSGRFWYNKVAMKMVRDGELSKEKYAEIFNTSTCYVDWCLKNEGRILEAGQ
jgi:hypothetical protein